MQVSELVSTENYPNVRRFIEVVLDMQLGDVRAMMQLPRPEIGIMPACNFAIVSTLCNLISGISTTIYRPPEKSNGAGKAFRGLVLDFFPYTPAGASNFPQQLYELFRNPLAHAVGLRTGSTPAIA